MPRAVIMSWAIIMPWAVIARMSHGANLPHTQTANVLAACDARFLRIANFATTVIRSTIAEESYFTDDPQIGADLGNKALEVGG